jgi:cell division protein FtsZ
VIAGMAVNPEMQGELRVTIVAAGLGQGQRDEAVRVKLVQTVGAEMDYRPLEKPTVLRNKTEDKKPVRVETNPDYLDIPAFLRRQAD